MSQHRMAALMGVSRTVISKWERNEACPNTAQQAHLRDLNWQPPAALVECLAASIQSCAVARALTCSPKLRLLSVSPLALAKRPSIVDWVGRDLAGIATGILQEILDDAGLQKAIRRREIGGIVSTTASVLATPEAPRIGMYRTTTTYFYHEAKLYSDAMSVLVAPDERHGYTPIYTDEMGQDLFGDRDRLEAALLKSTHPAGAAAR